MDSSYLHWKTTPKLGISTRNVFLYLHIFGFGEYKLNDKNGGYLSAFIGVDAAAILLPVSSISLAVTTFLPI